MSFRNILLFLAVFAVTTAFATNDWGKTGHRATGEIAEQHLSRKAKKNITKLLDGASLAIVSTYGDEIKSDEAYRAFGPWHYVNFAFGTTYEASQKNSKGDILVAIDKCIAVLKDENAAKDEKAFYLKMLVHFIGDLHQPLHVGLGEDRGGNDFQVRWFNDGTNLHRVWDTEMIESYRMTYTELATNTKELTKQELLAIKNGTVKDWMYDSKEVCEEIYESVSKGEKLGYNYMYKYVPIMQSQLQKGGIRLAVLLNDIFG